MRINKTNNRQVIDDDDDGDGDGDGDGDENEGPVNSLPSSTCIINKWVGNQSCMHHEQAFLSRLPLCI